MDRFRQDLRHAVRQLAGNRTFTLLAVATLALGIGANAAIFSVVNGVMLRPLPYPDPERVTYLSWNWQNGQIGALSAYKYEHWREHSLVFDGVATLNTMLAEVRVGDAVDEVQGMRITEDFLRVIGLPPILGRDFRAEEDEPGGPLAAILSHEFWRDRLDADPEVIGSTIRIDGQPHTVVGVLPPGFRYPGAPGHENILVPLRLRADPSDTGHNYNVLARISSGVSPERVRADMAAVYSRFAQEHPELTVEGERAMGFMSFQDLYVGGMQRTLWVLMGTVGLVLLIACANVANLLLARATSRRREIATRVALGATRGQIVSQLLTESLVLALIAGVAGLLLSIWSLHLMLALLPEVLPRMEDIGVDVRVLAFTLAVAFMTGLAFGLAAALPASRTELITSIKEGTPGGGSHGGRRAQSVLVAAEVALSLILLAGANLLIASFLKVTAVETGFNARDVLTVNLGRAPEGYDSGARLAELERRLVERLRDVPGITSVAAASNLPLQRGWNISMELDGRPGEGESAIEWRAVSPEYFAALEIPVVRGRGFTTFDGESSASVAIINEATARHYWPNSDPIGQRLWVSRSDGRPAAEIVGVVGDIREIRLGLPPRRTVYVPQAQTPPSMMGGLPRLMIRTTRRAAAVEAVKEALPEIDPRLREPTVLSMDDVVAASIANERFNMLFIGSFAGVALLLTMVGIFGVVSYAVRQRVREIAIRMALGAAGPSVGRMVVRQGMRAVMLGLAIGLLGAFALTRVIAGMLYGVTPTDPVSFASALVLLVGVALAAGYIPARRATHVDPMITLRAE